MKKAILFFAVIVTALCSLTSNAQTLADLKTALSAPSQKQSSDTTTLSYAGKDLEISEISTSRSIIC